MQTGDRLYVFDNIKGILIYLVVFAHLLECAGLTGCFAYRLIYVFHMPVFLFVSGFFARFSPKKLLTDLVWPYVLFQVVFLLFDGFVINPGTFRLQFTKPYWILWYLFVLIIYTLLTGIIKPKKPVIQITAVAVFTVLALLAGYAGRIGYEFSASRLIVFSPFFFSGFFLGQNKAFKDRLSGKSRDEARWKELYPNLKYAGGSAFAVSPAAVVYAAIAVVLCIILLVRLPQISPKVLWGSYPYASTGTGPVIRLLCLLMAAVWICLALFTVPNKKLFVLTTAGRNSLSVYLLHVFICRLLSKFRILRSLPAVWAVCLVLAFVIVFLLGSEPVAKIFRKIATAWWLRRNTD